MWVHGTATPATLQADTISLLNSSIIWALAAAVVGAKRREGGRDTFKASHFPGMYETTYFPLWEWMGAAA